LQFATTYTVRVLLTRLIIRCHEEGMQVVVENVLLFTEGGQQVDNVQFAVRAAEPETTGIPKCKKEISIAAGWRHTKPQH